MARIPFHSVGIMPFFLGTILAWKICGTFNLPVFIWSTLAVVMIMLSTYFAGEYYDEEVDRLSASMERNRFTGGSQAVIRGLVPARHAKTASYLAIAFAGVIGVLLQFHYKTGFWTIPLGLTGIICGFFYSTEPLRWVKRGIGEIMIGYSYGWLPVAASFYLQSGTMIPLVHWLSVPVALTIFNVILINEFPDYPADLKVGKTTLAVRLGKDSASRLYSAAGASTILSYPMAVFAGLPRMAFIFYPVLLALSLYTITGMVKRDWEDRDRLEHLCGLTIVINLFVPVTYIMTLFFGAD